MAASGRNVSVMIGRLIISRGGSREDERLLIESLVSEIGTDARL